ncbi:MAG: cation diffusion facilitator family transporter [Thermodesulfovibrionales bacterium]
MDLTVEKRLKLSLAVTVLILLAEVLGGMLSNSLALLSDAGHVLTDAFALGLSMIAALISKRPSDYRATYGYQRVGLLAAVINGLSLLGIAIFIFIESYNRFIKPPEIDISLMLIVATGGLIGNLIMALILGRGHEDLNIRSAWLHILGDTLSSIGVITSGIVIYFTNWLYADPIAGLIIGIVIISGGWRVVKEATLIFLEMTPKGFNVEEIAKKISEMPEVMGIHDLHIWSLAHRRIAFSAHIWVHDQKLSEVEGIRKKIENMLRGIGIGHILIQFECAECETTGLYCQVQSEEDASHRH